MKKETASVAFARAIERAEHLQLRPGLSALKPAEGKGRVHKGERALLGSVVMDDDCRTAFPTDPRWDYVIGVDHDTVAHFVEVHSAETSAVSKMEQKLRWLMDYLARPAQTELAKLPRAFHWVASGRVNIPQNTPQYRRLKTGILRQLRGPVERLDLP